MTDEKTLKEEETRAYYAQWLEKPLWRLGQAERLLACPPCLDVEFCELARSEPPTTPKKIEKAPSHEWQERWFKSGWNEKVCPRPVPTFEDVPETDEDREKRKILARPCQKNLINHRLRELIDYDLRTGLFPSDKRGMVRPGAALPFILDSVNILRQWLIDRVEPLAVIEWAMSKPGVTVPQPILDCYYKQKAHCAAIEAGEVASIPASDEEPQKLPIFVNVSLWAGQSAEVAYKILKKKYDDLDLIALILHDTCNGTKQEKSRLLMPSQSDEKSRVKQFNRMLKRAEKRYKITYIE